MRNHIRYGFVTALAAIAISAASAAAAPPAWFDGADRDHDGSVTWNEYARNSSAFEALDENGDGSITRSEEFGGTSPRSSWSLVATQDFNRNGVVTLREYTRQLRATFNAYDLDHDGVLSDRETSALRQPGS
jgi:Ca2+-binding EF-hand superfamily protein